MNWRKEVLKQLETLSRYSLGIHTYGDREPELREALEYWESKRKVHRADEGDGWTLWKLGKA